MGNPFTIGFGKKPLEYISRVPETNKILEDLRSPDTSSQIYMITGVRGAGKTVMMTDIAEQLRADDDWIVVELNPERDLLHTLAAKLYSVPELQTIFLDAHFDFSVFGIGLKMENSTVITDIEVALDQMLEQVRTIHKNVLVLIDEVTNTEQMHIFSSAFQIFIRKNLPINLLMTGLYENLYNLQNEKSLTFLYRAPKIELEPLNMISIQKRYEDIFGIDAEIAARMSVATKGYSFAFQTLGYLLWEKFRKTENQPIVLEAVYEEYDHYLNEYVYSKIWSELSATDKSVLIQMAEKEDKRTKEIRDKLDMSSSKFSVYRDRLKKKGLLDTSNYGKIDFALPRFDIFVNNQAIYM